VQGTVHPGIIRGMEKRLIFADEGDGEKFFQLHGSVGVGNGDENISLGPNNQAFFMLSVT
jgi:hypothetical protein